MHVICMYRSSIDSKLHCAFLFFFHLLFELSGREAVLFLLNHFMLVEISIGEDSSAGTEGDAVSDVQEKGKQEWTT